MALRIFENVDSPLHDCRGSVRGKACCFLLIALLAGCGKKKAEDAAGAEAEPPTAVMVETAGKGAIDRVITADAVLYPIDQANVTAKINAPVTRVLVNRGDHVRAGQVLLELESADLAAAANEAKHQIDQAQAAYDATATVTVVEDRNKAQADAATAQAAVDAAQHTYDRLAALNKEGALAQRPVDDAKATLTQAQLQLQAAQKHLATVTQAGQREAVHGAEVNINAAKAHYDTTNVQLTYAKVKSPISGVVADRAVYPGEMAASGTPLVSIVNISEVRAVANVPVKDAEFIKVGRPARIAGPDGDIAGKVTVVSPSVNPATTTVEVWVTAPNPGEKLKPGGTVRVAIIAETLQNILVVPAAALLNSDTGGSKVMVITPDMVAHERMVTVGVRQGDRVQILSGVQEGDQVVTTGGLGLEDKAKVVIQAPKEEDDDDDNADEPGK
jgi:multidrug efflux pump subunit AcrA (membrane-fusion protein)